MKAYIVGLRSNDDVGNEIVFAKNSKEAMKKAQSLDLSDWKESYIDVYVKRNNAFDGLENDSDGILIKKWQEGWSWFDKAPGMPEPETSTEQEFFDWYTS